MSLNGLDSAAVLDCYASAQASAGGWFLLKYTSRDGVEVYKSGNGGAIEARSAVAEYTDPMPLYGFLLYRRRKVIIKFTPDGISRLLQARVSVHFQSVLEKFSPNDTVLAITCADELNDSTLVAACALHTAAAGASSGSSVSSTKRRKLDEITESAEEGPTGDTLDDSSSLLRVDSPATPRPQTAQEEAPETPQPAIPEEDSSKEVEQDPPPIDRPKTSDAATTRPSTARRSSTEDVRPVSRHDTVSSETTVKIERNALAEPEKPPSVAGGLKVMHSISVRPPPRAGDVPRASTASGRPSLSELVAYGYKPLQPKVKLGPRPSMDRTGRPRTAGSGAGPNPDRPKSSLPAGMRVHPRQGVSSRPQSRDSHLAPTLNVPAPPPVPDVPSISIVFSDRPRTSPASVKSLPATLPKSARITPEKQRLMRALELRKKQMNLKTPAPESSVPPVPVPPSDKVAQLDRDDQKPDDQHLSPKRSSLHDHVKADSAVEIEHRKLDAAAENAAPTSPEGSSGPASSATFSTRPTSLSESSVHSKAADQNEQITAENFSDSDETPVATEQPEEENHHAASITPTEDASEPRPSSVNSEATFTNTRDIVTANLSEATETEQQDDNPLPLRSQSDVPHTTVDDVEEASLPIATASPKQSPRDSMRRKRRAMVEPIHVEMSAESSEAEYLSDDSLMDELQSATVQEAMPVAYSMSKSPITPVFPRPRTSNSPPLINQRSTSDSVYCGKADKFASSDSEDRPRSSIRSSSANWADATKAQQGSGATPKKINVGAGIAQRMKALAEQSNRDSTATITQGSNGPTSHPASSIVSLRKSSFRSASPDSSTSSRPQSAFTTHIAPQLKQTPRASWKPVPPPLQPIDTAAAASSIKSRKRESISVTARIIRDPRVEKPDLAPPTDSTPLELHQSPIVIESKVQSPPPVHTSALRSEPATGIPSSPISTKDAPLPLPRSSSDSSWRPFGRVKSPSNLPRDTSNASVQSNGTLDSPEEEKEDKKGSKASRMLKRMSLSISNTSRKGLAVLSPTVKEEQEVVEATPSKARPKAIDIGELNVQFPDTLLWKRKWVAIDGYGNLVFGPCTNDHTRGIIKKYHLDEFRPPFIPDQDMQELPNSVIFDFTDGRSLQCACGDASSQVTILKVLQQAHRDWLAFGAH